MTITLIQPLPIGNALRLFMTPPAGAAHWRVLRRSADVFNGPDDGGAVKVADESTDNVLLDDLALANNVSYFYRAYYWVSGVWQASATASGTPAATYRGDDIDPLTILRDRLAAGLAVEVKRGVLIPQSGKVPVITAPFGMIDKITFPCVSVHLDSDGATDRGIGEMLFPDAHDLDGGWTETEGWLSRVQLNVVGVSLNPDERIALRQAIQRIITGNLPVFDARGLVQCEFSQRDTEDFSQDNAPLFMTSGIFTCMTPNFIQNDVGKISDITSEITLNGMEPL